MKRAMFFEMEDSKRVRCTLCPRLCLITDGNIGFCGVRKNVDGVLYSIVYSKPVSLFPDPIEKKPLFHFHPGSIVFSLGTHGCNFRCAHCQNWEISQNVVEDIPEVSPEKVVRLALKTNSQGIAYTYNDPIVFFEYAHDTMRLANEKAKKLYHVFVTNGYIEEKPLKKAEPFLDAVNIDFKGFNERVYEKLCVGAKLDIFLERLKSWAKKDIWIELTNLIIPKWNDNPDEIKAMCKWIVDHLGKGVPIHFTRYFPYHKMKEPATKTETLEKAYKIAREQGLKYVYLGNIRTNKENTYCHNCDELLIERYGYEILQNKIKNNNCPTCGSKVDGVF
jgi:pyruvate formate lyase activating enzyme